jgi:uncharacterized membrane protein
MGLWPFVISGVFVVLGIPLAMRKVPPNGWYGIRTPETLSNTEIWYRVNALGGKATIAAGILSFLILLALNRFWTGDPAMKRMVGIVVPLGLFAVVLIVLAFSKQSS